MNKNHEFHLKKDLLDTLKDGAFLTFTEWYRTLLKLLQEYEIPHANEINSSDEMA
jgi:hypothetical protein